MVKLLLQRGSSPLVQCPRGRSPLHYALKGSTRISLAELSETLCLLIDKGADIHATDHKGRTVSFNACDFGRKYWYRDGGGRSTSAINSDLYLRRAWLGALRTCGYDAEGVIENDRCLQSNATGHEQSCYDLLTLKLQRIALKWM